MNHIERINPRDGITNQYDDSVQENLNDAPTRRTRVLTSIVATAGIIGGSTALLETLSTDDHAERIERNTSVITTAKEYIPNEIILKSGVKLRLSPEFQNGDNNTGEESNIAGEIPKGKSLRVTSAIVQPDGWIAFDKPTDKDPSTMTKHDMAEDLVYVSVKSLEQYSPDKITVSDIHIDNSYVDGEGHPHTFNPHTENPRPQLLVAKEVGPIIE